jgi:hypothetical protein
VDFLDDYDFDPDLDQSNVNNRDIQVSNVAWDCRQPSVSIGWVDIKLKWLSIPRYNKTNRWHCSTKIAVSLREGRVLKNLSRKLSNSWFVNCVRLVLRNSEVRFRLARIANGN